MQQGLMIRTAGNMQIAGALVEGAYAAENKRLMEELAKKEARIAALENELGLLKWARARENERKLQAVQERYGRMGKRSKIRDVLAAAWACLTSYHG